MKNSIKLFLVILLGVGITMATACKKEIEMPAVTTAEITSITSNSAVGGGDVTSDGNADITARGICYDRNNVSPTIENSKTTDGNSTGSFTSNISGLLPNTVYHVRAYVTNELGTSYGEAKEFTTGM